MDTAADRANPLMQHGPDPYARALADLDAALLRNRIDNEQALIEALANLDRVSRAGQRLADHLARIAHTDPNRRSDINSLLAAWQHALSH